MDEQDAIRLRYDLEHNKMIDEDGFVVWNIFEIITPNDWMFFRLEKQYMLVNHRTFRNVVVELYYPDDDYEFDI